MLSAERENLIHARLSSHPFLSFKELEQRVDASLAALRRDLHQLANEGRLMRVNGGVMANGSADAQRPAVSNGETFHLGGTSFADNMVVA